MQMRSAFRTLKGASSADETSSRAGNAGSFPTGRNALRPSAMGNPMYLSRVRLRRSAQINALLPLLLEGNPHGQHPDHHLMWYLFAEGDGTRERDFLWRRTGGGAYLILSARPPQDALHLFQIDEPKPFELGPSRRHEAAVYAARLPGGAAAQNRCRP